MQHAQTQPIRELEARGYTGEIRNTLRPALNNNGTPLLQHIRGAPVLARFVLAFTLLSFMTVDVTWARTQGELAAAQIPVVAKTPPPEPANLSEALQAMKETVHERRAAVAQSVRERSGFVDRVLNAVGASRLGTENLDAVIQRAGTLHPWHARQRDEFAQTEKRLRAKNVPDKILQRHRDAVAAYEAGFKNFEARLDRVRKADSLLNQDEALEQLQQQLNGERFTKSQEPFDPDAPLPFGPAEPADPREPSLTLDPVSARMTPAERVQANTERVLAKIGDVLIAPAHAAFAPPGTADLGESPEVTRSPAIVAKAAELHNSPVDIYNWVRNNVEWVPTYGSVQDADATLASLRGNSFAISSLLIALLRAANVPARYAYGVIEVPAEKAQNWVGGVDNPGAAQQVLGQGGIPNAAITAGGRVTSISMEHIWVEAFVDFEPSRGAKHVTGDSWVPMDASYKQYEFPAGHDVVQDVALDVEGMILGLLPNITYDAAAGWVQGLDETSLGDHIAVFRQQLDAYVSSKQPNTTVSDLLGGKYSIEFEPQTLSAGLPYHLEAITARYSEIPNPLRNKYTVSLAEKTPLAVSTDAKIFSVTLPLSVATSKAVALSFVPATQADEEVLLSYLPTAAPGQPIDPNALPNELPGYLIYVKAQLTLDGEVVAEGGSFSMGTELNLTHNFYDPRRNVRPVSSNIIAGEYHAIGIDGGMVNPVLLGKINAQLDQARVEVARLKAALSTGQSSVNSEFLTKHTLPGNILQTGMLGYFAINDALDRLSARTLGVVTWRMPSFGTFGTSLEPQYVFGSIPRNVKLAGVIMDVDRISTLAAAKDDQWDKVVDFHRTNGPRKSLYENLIPEQLFSTAQQPVQGVSGMKVLALAAGQNQKIYTLTQANAAQLNSLGISQAVKNDIAAALNANKEVTVHQSPITHAGWTGAGYIVLDPETGAGAYKLSGGTNGGAAAVNHYGTQMYTVSGLSDTFGVVDVSIEEATNSADAMNQAAAALAQRTEECLGDIAEKIVVAAVIVFAVALLVRVGGPLAAELGAGAVLVGRQVTVMIITALFSRPATAANGAVPTDCYCPSKIPLSRYGQCWVCPDDQYQPIIDSKYAAVDYRKSLDRANEGFCVEGDAAVVRALKAAAITDEIHWRETENACWDPQHEPHVRRVSVLRDELAECR